uniref:Monocyte to macrophage differentiation factor 2 n=1 Tax=Macrostomum lignano TaxID=282301 RepID=A0A1I8J6M8_9PLAT
MTSIHQQLLKSASQLNLGRFKNSRAAAGQAYVPTDQEHVANILSHGIMIPASIYKLHSMTSRSIDARQLAIARVYGLATLGLFSVSSVFHILAFWGRFRTLKEIFHRGDRVFIYLFIAASYTPWLVLRDYESDYGLKCLYAVWPAAVFGIAYQLIFHEKYKWLEVLLYVSVGALPSLKNPNGLGELLTGGAAYMCGVVFFKLDGIVPFAHAIWHLFVVIGSVLQYNAVSTHLVGLRTETIDGVGLESEL